MQPDEHLKTAVQIKLCVLKKKMTEVCKPHNIDNSNIYKFLDGRVNSEKAQIARDLVIQDIGLTLEDVEQVKKMAANHD